MRRIVVNTNYQGHSAYILVYQIGKKLADVGYEVTYNDWSNYLKYDLALFVAPDSEIEKAKKTNPNIIAGIIDPKLSKRKQIRESQLADFLAVTSLEQRDFFLRYNKNILVYYHFPEIKEIVKSHTNTNKDKIIIGYHGNKLHLNCMIDLSKALDDLSKKYNIELWAMYNIKELGKWKKNLPQKCPVKHIQWSRENYYRFLSKCDIGVIPAKIPISLKRGKFFTKFWDSFVNNWPGYNKNDYLIRFKYSTNPGRIYPFSQFYIPVVVEFLPSYCQIIQDGHSGFLVCSKEGWYDSLEKLINSSDLRNKMSRNLKKFIDKNYSPEINFRKFLNFLNFLVKKNKL